MVTIEITVNKTKNAKRGISTTLITSNKSMNALVNTNEDYNTNKDNLYWHVDNGASNHMKNNSKNMYNVHRIEDEKLIVVDKKELYAECTGGVDLTCWLLRDIS